MIDKFRKILLFSILSLMLTACGGSSSSGVDTDTQETAINKISDYAKNSQSNARPTEDDYIDAGVENLASIDIEELNDEVDAKDASEVDTLEELNSLVLSLIDTTAPVITLEGSTTISITIGTAYQEQGATALDDKDGTVEVSIDNSALDTSSVGVYQVIYTATDKVGNSAEKARSVNVILEPDTTAPELEIGSETMTIIKNATYTEPDVSATDDIDGVLLVTSSGEVDTSTVGTYTITYSVSDAAGNEASKTRTVKVILSEVGQLLEDAAKGDNPDVHYIVVGDSTRNFPFTPRNTILVDSYYPNQLGKINVDFDHTAYSGQEAREWLDNSEYYEKHGTYSTTSYRYTLNETLAKIPVSNHHNYIVEFSLGINDTKLDTKSTIKTTIRECIQTLHTERPNMKILMVSPVNYDLHAGDSYYTPTVLSSDLEDIYQEVYQELSNNDVNSYLSLVSGKEATDYVYDNHKDDFYGDPIHPNPDGSRRLINYVFSEIGSTNVYNEMTVSGSDTMPDLDYMHIELDVNLKEQ